MKQLSQEQNPYTKALNRYLSAQGYAVTPAGPGPAGQDVSAPAPADALERSHPLSTVVVGVDGSPGSYVAVDHAVIEAELRGWEIRLVHVQHPTLVRRTLFEQRDRGAALLSELGERIRSHSSGVPVATELRVGSLNDILVSESSSAGLTVLGHREYGTVAGILSPSVSLHLAAHATRPLFIVRVPSAPGAGWAGRPVLVGLDGSPGGLAALDFALAEARLRGVDLLAVHATREPVPAGAVRDPFAHGPLAEAAERVAGVRVRRRTIDGDPAESLVTASAHASAIVVGSRGHAALGRALPGAVSRAVVHRAHCPVFVVPPPGLA